MEQVIWEPGNGSRYDLLYGKDNSRGRYILAWMRSGGSGGTCIVWSAQSYLHYSYLCEKLNVNDADAAGIMTFLASKGHDVGFPEGYDISTGRYVGSSMENEYI